MPRPRYPSYSWYQPATPRTVKGGIKAQSKRGSFARQWWGRRWIEALEAFHIGARLSRGRSYARRGQVADLVVNKGEVRARVQGSRAHAYQVSIKLKRISKANWKKIGEALEERPLFMARLMAGDMPQAIEQVFEETSLPLFPQRKGDLKTACSCPDWSNPCKHIAAVHYLLGERFDNDPFLLFKLRGMSREELFELLAGPPRKNRPTAIPKTAKSESAAPDQEPLPTDAQSFWKTPKNATFKLPKHSIPSITAPLPRRLGNFPFWRGKEDFQDTLALIYEEASSAGLEITE